MYKLCLYKEIATIVRGSFKHHGKKVSVKVYYMIYWYLLIHAKLCRHRFNALHRRQDIKLLQSAKFLY